MPGGEGALEAQQQIAARIPYENIAVSPANKILNAFALGVEMNRRRAQMEQQMERLVLQQQKMEQDRTLKEQEMGLKQWGIEQSMGMREANLNLGRDRLQFAIDKQNDQIYDTSGLYNDLGRMKSKPGDPEYPSELNSIMANHARAALTPDGRQVQRLQEQQHNSSVAKQTSSVKADYDLFLKDVSHRLFQGGQPDVTAFDIPQMWQPQLDKDGKPTGKYFIPAGVEKYKDKSGNFVQHYGTLTEKEREDYIKRYQGIRERMNKLPSQINNPETGTQPIGVTGGMAPPPATQTTVKIQGGDGKVWTIPQDKLQDALNRGATVVQ